jgi:hypothetical protein
MVGGAWFLVRAILVWGVGGGEYPFGADMVVALVVIGAWVLAVILILTPPSAVLARPSQRPIRGLVWPLARWWRTWHFAAIPLIGVLAALAPFTIVTALGGTPGVEPNLLVGLPFGILLNAFALTATWVVLRGSWLGVEVTDTHLIARGYFVSRRFAKEEVVGARVGAVTGLAEFVLSTLMNRTVMETVRLTLRDGSRRTLYASNSSSNDLARGASLIQAWCASSEE